MSNPFYYGEWNVGANPFIMAIDDEGAGPADQQAPHVNQHAAGHSRCRLPEFWPHNPRLWFARAEFNFEVSGIMDQRQRFMLTANALTYDALTLVSDLVTAPPLEQPYDAIKERLLISHKLTVVQMAEKVLDMPDLGDRRPSQLLAAMLEYCPEGESNTAFFRASFFRRLPRNIRVLLQDEVRGDLQDMAIRADELFLHHRQVTVAAIGGAEEDCLEDLGEAVAALNFRGGQSNSRQSQARSNSGRPKENKQHNGGGGNGGGGGGDKGRSYFICNRHWKFGEKAFRCDAPQKCQWQGN